MMGKKILRTFVALSCFLVLSAMAFGQPPQGAGPPGGFGPGGPGGPGGPKVDRKLVKQFDANGDGWLNNAERKLALKEIAENPSPVGRRGGPGGRRGPGGRGGNREPAKPGPQVNPDDVKLFPNKSMYDPSVVRTVFFEFENDDWEKELELFHGTDVDVPARVTLDGTTYENVGIRFRGQSSFGHVPSTYKRSFNVSFDLVDKELRVNGYKTLNFLNSNGDPSFLSTVVYSQIAKDYVPVPKANHVHVVINGESWGIYINVQQFDKTLLAENFESTKGTRWKVDGNPGADGGLRYLGDDLEQYKERFDMKSKDGEKAWRSLVELCRTLNETPAEQLESALEPMLDIDNALKFLALDVALVNSDGYWTRASDYSLFLDESGKFHLIPHDMNESFVLSGGRGGPGGPGGRRGGGRRRGFGPPPGEEGGPEGDRGGPPEFGGERGRPADGQAGRPPGPPPQSGFNRRPGGQGPGGPGGPGGGPGHGGVDLDPLVAIDNPRMPLRSKLLVVPNLRERYLGYVNEIATKSMDWNSIGPFIEQQRDQIKSVVSTDTRMLDTNESFLRSTSSELTKSDGEKTPQGRGGMSLRDFLQQRSEFLSASVKESLGDKN